MRKVKDELHRLIESINDFGFLKRLLSLVKSVVGDEN